MARLKEKYTAEVAPALMKQFGYKSDLPIAAPPIRHKPRSVEWRITP